MNPDPILRCESKKHQNIHYELWTLNRPQALNALNGDLLSALKTEACRLHEKAISDPCSCRALLIQGAGGRAFAAGADIASMKSMGRAEAEQFSRLGQEAFFEIESLPVPTVALVDGFALGGGLELAMSCDLILATKASKFGQPEARLGLVPGFAATLRFVESLGSREALRFFYSGESFDCKDALRMGLIQEMFDDPEAMHQAVDALIGKLQLSSPGALRQIKKLCRELHRTERLAAADREARIFGELFESQDAQEGINAFLEKRSANFIGH